MINLRKIFIKIAEELEIAKMVNFSYVENTLVTMPELLGITV